MDDSFDWRHWWTHFPGVGLRYYPLLCTQQPQGKKRRYNGSLEYVIEEPCQEQIVSCFMPLSYGGRRLVNVLTELSFPTQQTVQGKERGQAFTFVLT